MKTTLTILLCIFCLTALPSMAQEEAITSKPGAYAPYKFSIGLRYANNGGPTGADIGATAKYFFTKQSAVEVQSTIHPKASYYLASLSYIWQPQLLTSARFRPYAGIGLSLIRASDNFSSTESRYSNLVITPSFGVEYQFKKLPLALSIDYRSTHLRLNTGSTTNNINLRTTSNIGFGLKYTFK